MQPPWEGMCCIQREGAEQGDLPRKLLASQWTSSDLRQPQAQILCLEFPTSAQHEGGGASKSSSHTRRTCHQNPLNERGPMKFFTVSTLKIHLQVCQIRKPYGQIFQAVCLWQLKDLLYISQQFLGTAQDYTRCCLRSWRLQDLPF